MLDTGTSAPGFERPGADGQEIGTYSLSEYTGTGQVTVITDEGTEPTVRQAIHEAGHDIPT